MEKVYVVLETDGIEDIIVAIFSNKEEADKCADSKDFWWCNGRVVEEEKYDTFKGLSDELKERR